jgi:hypothetical protein
MGGPATWGMDEGLTTPDHKKINVLRNVTQGRETWTDASEGPKYFGPG